MQKIGINTWANFTIGYPFELKEDLDLTVKFAADLEVDFLNLSRITPLPGTPLFNMLPPEKQVLSAHQEGGMGAGSSSFFFRFDSQDRLYEQYTRKILFRFYLNPKRLQRIFRILSFKHLVRLFVYALRSLLPAG